MKKKIFMACAALVVSAAAVVGVKAYNRSQMSDLALSNVEALSREETLGNVVGACGRYTTRECEKKCPECPRTWKHPSSKTGPVIKLVGKCTCGHEFNYILD